MAAWTEAERVKIRRYLGFSAIFLQADPRLENALTAVLAVADGGTRPDDSTQQAILGYLTQLEQIDLAIYGSGSGGSTPGDCCVSTVKVNGVEFDSARGDAILRSKARNLVGRIADALSTRPRRDVYSPPGTQREGFDLSDYAERHL